MPRTIQIPSSKIINIYTLCCAEVRNINGIAGKRMMLKLAMEIHGLLDGGDGEEILMNTARSQKEKQVKDMQDKEVQEVMRMESREVQTEEIQSKKQQRLSTSEVSLSIKSKNQSMGNLEENDDILEETIQKYQNLIETLYTQLQQLQNPPKPNPIPQADPTSPCQNCPQLQKQLSFLKKQIKKRDIAQMKKMQAK